jgi:glycopeptide antibiotics resistance protein
MVMPVARVVRVRKGVTLLLLLAVSATIVLLTFSLSGRAYARESDRPFGEVRLLASRLAAGGYTNAGLLALMLPAISNMIVFLPWGFLMFIWVDRPTRPLHVSYLLTLGMGMTFALALGLWQVTLPTRVTDASDAIWNSVGALSGALLGQLRKRVRVAFE